LAIGVLDDACALCCVIVISYWSYLGIETLKHIRWEHGCLVCNSFSTHPNLFHYFVIASPLFTLAKPSVSNRSCTLNRNELALHQSLNKDTGMSGEHELLYQLEEAEWYWGDISRYIKLLADEV